VAGYIAKYATKATESFGAGLDRRIGADDLERLDRLPAHVAELVRACWELGVAPSWRGLGASTRAKSYRLLSRILGTAVESGYLARNPCTIRGAAAEPAPEMRFATVAEVAALADAIPRRFRALVLVAALLRSRKPRVQSLAISMSADQDHYGEPERSRRRVAMSSDSRRSDRPQPNFRCQCGAWRPGWFTAGSAITGGFIARLRSQECQYGEDAAMVVGGGGQVEAGEDAAHVRLDGLGAEEQPIADGLV
jgi:hypothetical protein